VTQALNRPLKRGNSTITHYRFLRDPPALTYAAILNIAFKQCFCVTMAHACGCKVALQPVFVANKRINR
jgi:hypothetical protein